jgi:hypothetical protein
VSRGFFFCLLDLYPAAETPGERKAVGIFEVSSHGEARGKAADFHGVILQDLL